MTFLYCLCALLSRWEWIRVLAVNVRGGRDARDRWEQAHLERMFGLEILP